jgi:hypothetical protein
LKIEIKANFGQNERQHQFFGKMEDDRNFKVNGRQSQFQGK